MGLHYVNAVLNGLKGRKVVGKKKLSSAEIALLVTIANNQPNPGASHGDMDPICYGDVGTMSDYAHLSRAKFFKTRDLLVESGLITYSPSERRADFLHIGGMRTYNNVYRINLKVLREFYPDLEEWKRAVLRLGEKDELPESVLRALAAVSNRDSTVSNRDFGVSNRDTNINKTKKENIKNNNTSTCANVNYDYLCDVVGKMSKSLIIPVEKINRRVVKAAIAGKFLDSVYQIVQKPSQFVGNADNKVGAMVSELKKLPDKENDPAFLHMAKQPDVGEIARSASPEVQCLLEDVKKNTGYTDPRFLDEIAIYLQRLLKTDEGRREAVEICDKYKFCGTGKNNETIGLALGVQRDLNAAYSKFSQ